MSVTAHKIAQIFHVSYTDLLFTTRPVIDALQTELFDDITTEALDVIEIEYEGDAIILNAHKIKRNAFIATNKRITGA